MHHMDIHQPPLVMPEGFRHRADNLEAERLPERDRSRIRADDIATTRPRSSATHDAIPGPTKYARASSRLVSRAKT